MNILEIENNKIKLTTLKKNILSRFKLLDKDNKKLFNSIPKSINDWAISVKNDEVGNKMDLQDNIELQRISEALKRIEVGTFGICVSCSSEISNKRLKAMPFAANCMDCENNA